MDVRPLKLSHSHWPITTRGLSKYITLLVLEHCSSLWIPSVLQQTLFSSIRMVRVTIWCNHRWWWRIHDISKGVQVLCEGVLVTGPFQREPALSALVFHLAPHEVPEAGHHVGHQQDGHCGVDDGNNQHDPPPKPPKRPRSFSKGLKY